MTDETKAPEDKPHGHGHGHKHDSVKATDHTEATVMKASPEPAPPPTEPPPSMAPAQEEDHLAGED